MKNIQSKLGLLALIFCFSGDSAFQAGSGHELDQKSTVVPNKTHSKSTRSAGKKTVLAVTTVAVILMLAFFGYKKRSKVSTQEPLGGSRTREETVEALRKRFFEDFYGKTFTTDAVINYQKTFFEEAVRYMREDGALGDTSAGVICEITDGGHWICLTLGNVTLTSSTVVAWRHRDETGNHELLDENLVLRRGEFQYQWDEKNGNLSNTR